MTRYPIELWPSELTGQAYMEHPDGRRLVPTQAVADLFGCGASNLREMRRVGKLAATVWRQGNAHYYDMEDVAAAYLERFPLKVQRPEVIAADAEAEARLEAAPFLRRREAAEAPSETQKTASDNAQGQRQGNGNETARAFSPVSGGEAVFVPAEIVAALSRMLEASRAAEAERAELREVLTQQAGTIEALARTVEAQTNAMQAQAGAMRSQREEMERMRKAASEAAQSATEERQRARSWWARLRGRD